MPTIDADRLQNASDELEKSPHRTSFDAAAKDGTAEQFLKEDDAMTDEARRERAVPTETQPKPNISTENQPEGSARRPSDTLDREPKRDPVSGASIPSDYNPDTGTRVGEENDTKAGREHANPR